MVLLGIVTMTSAAAADKALGFFRDWSAMQFGTGKEQACMAFSQPTSSEGDYTRRGDAFVFVTNRPAAGERGRVSLDTGYTYQPGSPVTVTVDTLVLELRTDGSTAWLDGEEETGRLLAAMRSGREMVVEGTSNRGTRTVDRYSLYGFTAAYRAIGKACPTP